VPGDAAQNPGAISGITITAGTTPMFHAIQGPQGLLQQPMAGLPLELRQKPNATGIFFPSHSCWSRAIAMGPLGVIDQKHGRGSTCWNANDPNNFRIAVNQPKLES
jgi:hypothetical protein